jgi:hypothetical protein
VNLRRAAVAALALLGVAVVLAPWYTLATYTPNGWDATWWARGALVAAVVAIAALRAGRDREAAALAGVALACVLFRAIVPPDFGLGFDGLDVPTERSWGLWVALGAALLGLAAAVGLERRDRDTAAP